MVFIKNVRIKGGVHNRHPHQAGVTEEQIEKIVDAVASAVRKETSEEAWVTIEYTKTVGHKINS